MTLWFFKEIGIDRCYLAHTKPSKREIIRQGKRYSTVPGFYYLGANPRGMPPLQPGECISVELVALVKNKKARKG